MRIEEDDERMMVVIMMIIMVVIMLVIMLKIEMMRLRKVIIIKRIGDNLMMIKLMVL